MIFDELQNATDKTVREQNKAKKELNQKIDKIFNFIISFISLTTWAAALPQLYKVWNSSTEGVSIFTWSWMFLSCTLWTSYSIRFKHQKIVILDRSIRTLIYLGIAIGAMKGKL